MQGYGESPTNTDQIKRLQAEMLSPVPLFSSPSPFNVVIPVEAKLSVPRSKDNSRDRGTLKKRLKREVNDDQLEESKDLMKMKQYISQVETVLADMKEWISQKEKSISSKGSFCSKGSKNRIEGDQSKKALRLKFKKNSFFGNSNNPDHDGENGDYQSGKYSDNEDSGQKRSSRNSKDKREFNQYIKDCFLAKVKDRLIPCPPKPSSHRNPSSSLNRKQMAKPNIGIGQDPIEFLTPMKPHDHVESAIKIIRDERIDSLTYTISRRRSSLRKTGNTEIDNRSINNFD
jgi:hypothetical protein